MGENLGCPARCIEVLGAELDSLANNFRILLVDEPLDKLSAVFLDEELALKTRKFVVRDFVEVNEIAHKRRKQCRKYYI